MLSRLRREIEKDKFRSQARQGYPITRTPYTPPIIAEAVDIDVFQGHNVRLKLTFARKGSELVKTKSLEFIRKYLMVYFTNHPAILQRLKESPLPSNTIAVTFTMNNFSVERDGCTDYFQLDRILDLGDYTHQRLSENLQATYLNLDGVQYLAGICYYPVLHGMPKMRKLDRKLMHQAIRGAEYYPSKNRISVDRYYDQRVYGRYCETAGKHVVVNFADEKRGVCHQEIDYTKKDAYKFTRCAECAEEKKTYKYVRPEKVAPVTPSTPKIQQPVPKEPAPVKPAPSDDAEMLNLLNSSKIGLPELKKLVGDATTKAQETSHKNSEQPKKNTTTIIIHLKSPPTQTSKTDALVEDKSPKLSESSVTSESVLFEEKLPEGGTLITMETEVAEPTEGVKDVPLASPTPLLEANPAQDPSHSESLVPDSDIPCEGPEEVCPFTPTKPLLETNPVLALSLLEQSLKSVIAEDGTTCSDEDNTSLISTESRLSSPAQISQPSELSDYSEDFFDKNFENMDAVSDEIQKLQENLDFDSISDEDAEVISSASSTESLMEDFEKVEKEITDVDSDIDVEIVN